MVAYLQHGSDAPLPRDHWVYLEADLASGFISRSSAIEPWKRQDSNLRSVGVLVVQPPRIRMHVPPLATGLRFLGGHITRCPGGVGA